MQICSVLGLAQLNLAQRLPGLATMIKSSQSRCDLCSPLFESSTATTTTAGASVTSDLRQRSSGSTRSENLQDEMGRPVPVPSYLLSVGPLPAAPIPIPISSKRQPPNRRKLLPGWGRLMSYRGERIGRPEQRVTHSSASPAPPLPFRSRPAALGETSRRCWRSQRARVRNLGRHPPTSARAGPDSAGSRTVIASHPVIPSWALARGKPSPSEPLPEWSWSRATRCSLSPTLPLTRQVFGKHKTLPTRET